MLDSMQEALQNQVSTQPWGIMQLTDYKDLPDSHYESLPALVPEGADRQEILNGVVDRWAVESQDLIPEDSTLFFGYQSERIAGHPSTLMHVDLRDDNPGADVIDLGELIRLLLNRLPGSLRPYPVEINPTNRIVYAPLAQAVIPLVGCRVRKCTLNGLRMPIHFGIYGCRFDKGLSIARSTFNGRCDFICCLFHGLNGVFDTRFNGPTHFISSEFISHATFNGCVFSGHAVFCGCVFGGSTSFNRSWFSSRLGVSFYEAAFGEEVSLPQLGMGVGSDGVFGEVDFRYCDLSESRVPLSVYGWINRWRLRMTDWLNWEWVSTVGELTVLTRASYVSLAIIPILAGLWSPLMSLINSRTGVEVGVTMPMSWLLGFIAALAVTLGHFAYQSCCPSLVRRRSTSDAVSASGELLLAQPTISAEALRESLDHMAAASRKMPHRHSRWFVKRERRTVWIPDRLEFFKDDEDIGKMFDVEASAHRQVARKRAKDQVVRADTRKRIAVEEGQKARYAVHVFKRRFAAWISGGLYLVSGWLLVVIAGRQLANVAEVSSVPQLARLMGWSRVDGLIWVMVVAILVMTLAGAVLASNSDWITRPIHSWKWKLREWWWRNSQHKEGP